MKANFTVPCNTASLYEIRQFIREKLSHLGVSENSQYQIVLAVDEACANAIIHGNDSDESNQLELEIVSNQGNLTIKIWDVGEYPRKKPTLNIQKRIKQKRMGGLGLHLIYSIMDDVQFFNEANYNVCQLTKELQIS